MTKIGDLVEEEVSKNTTNLMNKLDNTKISVVSNFFQKKRENELLSKAVLAIESQIKEQKKILSDYYKIKKNSLKEETNGIFLPPSQAKMIWQGNQTAIVLEKEDKSLLGKEMLFAEENKCYGKIKVIDVVPIGSNNFGEFSSAHRLSNDDKERLFGKKDNLYLYNVACIKKFETPIPVAFSEIGLVEEMPFLLGEEIEFKDEKIVKDFMMAVGSTDLVNVLPEPNTFVRTLFELVKQEKSLLKQREGIVLFEPKEIPKPNAVFYSKPEAINYFLGDD
jgi:hypothetical protein